MLSNFYKNIIIETLKEKVKFAFLFGSALTDYFNKKSDIDVAIWLNDFPLSVNEIMNLKYQVEKSINFEHDIDIVVLNNADLIITNQIITKGKIIINKNQKFTDNFILSRRSMYFDFKFFRKNLEDNLKTKVL